jgi:hypothetical protein
MPRSLESYRRSAHRAASFDQNSVIGVLTNLIAVPLSGPILTLGLLGCILGNIAPALAYPLNATNGFLVTLLEWTARVVSSLPFATVTTPGITPLLVGLFYVGCVPAAIAEAPKSAGRCGPPSSSSGRRCGSRSSAPVASRVEENRPQFIYLANVEFDPSDFAKRRFSQHRERLE